MKEFLKKHWAFIGLIAGFLVDHYYDIMQNTGLPRNQIDLIYLFGVLVVGYFWNPKKGRRTKKGGAVIPDKGF
jgi:hypothetical protein